MATYIGKVNVGGSELPVGSTLYGTCATGAGTAAKVVTMANFDELITGVTIHVKFTYSNAVANPTLNVNGTGAKTIYRYGTTAPSTSAETSWNAGAVVSFTYDGNYWQMNDWVNDNTKYTPASATPVMDGTAAVGSSAKYAREDHVHPSDTSRVPTSRTVNGKALSSNISLTASDVGAIATSAKGVAGGVAELDSNGLVPTSQLPSFVDDVLEYLSKSSFPETGETGKIYVDTTTNLTYRWSGSAYVEISPSLALGTTSSTAFRGDYGNAAYAHAVTNKGSAFSSGLYKITTNAEGHVTAATAVAKSDITALGIPGSDTNTWNAMTGAPSSANGTVCYVNAVPPKDGYNTKYLRADGTWSVPPDNNTTYGLSISGHTVSIVEGGSTSSVTVPDNNTTYGLSISGHTVSLVEGGTTASVTVPDNNDNNAVTQTATSTSANYEVLFSATADNTTRTEGARKNNNLTFNPNTGNLQVTQINGVTVGSSPKFTDNNTTYSAGTGLSLSSTTFNHSNSVTAGTAGTSSATSGSTLAVPYVTYDAQGHITATGTHTHTVSGFLTSHQTIKQDGVTGATVNRFGTCGTAAATAAKTVSITTGTFSLEAGATVAVSFTNANTANSPTLNVGSTGAKNIFVNGAQITSGTNKAMLKGTVLFIYDGTQYHLIGNYTDTDNNTTYGLSISDHTVSLVAGGTTSSVTVPDNNTKYGLSISDHTISLVEGGTTASVTVPDNNTNNAVTQTATTTSANYEVLFSATADNTTRTEGARKNNNLTFNPNTGNLQVTQINGVTVGSSPKFTDNNTTYSAGTGLSLSSTTFNHSNSVTAGTAGTSSATSGSTLAVPYVTYDAQGHVTGSGTHTHTVSGFLTSHQTIKQDGVTGATVNRYGACTTAAATAAKTVSVTTGTFSLEAGARVSVKFNNANTASSPTLNVNSTGAKNIFHKGAQITSGGNKALLAGICDFIYDGTQWHLVGNYIDTDNNTTYGLSISGHTVSLVSGGTTSSVTVPDNNTTYTANTTSIGSASGWSAGTAASASVANGVLTITNGTKPALTVTSTTVATGITAS